MLRGVHRSQEGLVGVQRAFQSDAGSVVVLHVIEHIHRPGAAAAYGNGEVVGAQQRRPRDGAVRMHDDGSFRTAHGVRHGIGDGNRCGKLAFGGQADPAACQRGRGDGAAGRGGDGGDGKHPAHGIDVVGQRREYGGVVGVQRDGIVRGDGCRTFRGGRGDGEPYGSRGLLLALRYGERHMIGAGRGRGERECVRRSVEGHGCMLRCGGVLQ